MVNGVKLKACNRNGKIFICVQSEEVENIQYCKKCLRKIPFMGAFCNLGKSRGVLPIVKYISKHRFAYTYIQKNKYTK
jgi:hypothetical protein